MSVVSPDVAKSGSLESGDPQERLWVTWAFTLGLAAVFCVTWWDDGMPLTRGAGRLSYSTLVQWGGCEVIEVREAGGWWRLITGNLLHGAWWHALLNIWAWFGLAAWAESALGRRSLLAATVLGGLASTAAALVFSDAPMVVGFSGSVFAVGGLLLASWDRSSMRDFPMRSLVFWFGVTLLLGLVWEGISQAGHLGGLVAGLFVGWAMRGDRAPASVFYIVVIAGVVLLLATRAVLGTGAEAGSPARVWALLGRERVDDAGREMRRVLSEGWPLDAEAANSIAYELSLRGESLDLALELADRALLELPGDPNVLDTRGWIACRIGRSREGTEFIRLALEAGADSEEVRAHLVDCVGAALGPR